MKKTDLRLTAVLLLIAVILSSFLVSCAGESGPESTGETEAIDHAGPKWSYVRDASLPDYATAVSFNANGLDSDFDKTGRGRVTVEQFIDGDTVHFWNNSHTEVIKVRFIAIDTPESTGKVEPWGNPASLYTKSKLSNAEEIALESDVDGKAVLDSTGGRYLAWVWYREKDSDVWRNLNIEILADGLALGKSATANRYGDTAFEAVSGARAEKINMYSGEQDPLFFYGETVELSIKSLIMNKDTYDGIKVRFDGLVTKQSGEGVYMESFDEDTQQFYGVYVYGGYASLAPKFLVPGYRLRVTGTADNNENFGFQVSGLSFSLIDPSADDTKILEKNVEVVPTEITADELLTNESLENTYVYMRGLTVTGVYTTDNPSSSSNGAMTLTCRSEDGKTVTVRTSILTLDGEIVTEEYFYGRTMNVSGIITYFEGKPQIRLFSLADAEITV